MPGVEILATKKVLVSSGIRLWPCILIAIGAFFIFTVICWITIDSFSGGSDSFWTFWMGIVAGCLAGIAFFFIASGFFHSPKKYETHYQVIISDSVLMNEFLEKYEILNIDGKIYTIKEKME